MTRTMLDLEEELGRIYGLVGELSGMSILLGDRAEFWESTYTDVGLR